MRKSLSILLLILLLMSTELLLAQGNSGPPGSGGPPSPPGNGDVNDVSITSFLWLLALAGAYLGFKKANNP